MAEEVKDIRGDVKELKLKHLVLHFFPFVLYLQRNQVFLN